MFLVNVLSDSYTDIFYLSCFRGKLIADVVFFHYTKSFFIKTGFLIIILNKFKQIDQRNQIISKIFSKKFIKIKDKLVVEMRLENFIK